MWPVPQCKLGYAWASRNTSYTYITKNQNDGSIKQKTSPDGRSPQMDDGVGFLCKVSWVFEHLCDCLRSSISSASVAEFDGGVLHLQTPSFWSLKLSQDVWDGFCTTSSLLVSSYVSSSSSASSSVAVTLPQSALPGGLQSLWDVTMSYLLMLTGCLSLWCLSCSSMCRNKPEEVYLWLIIVTRLSFHTSVTVFHRLIASSFFVFPHFPPSHIVFFCFLNFVFLLLCPLLSSFPSFPCNFLSFFFSFLFFPF